MAEKEIILKYKVDLSEMNEATAQMEQTLRKTADTAKIEPVSKDAVKDIRAANTELGVLQKEISELEKLNNEFKTELSQVNSEIKKVGKSWNAELPNMKKNAEQLEEAIRDNELALKNMKIDEKAIKTNLGGMVSMKKELRLLKEQLASGELSGAEFDQAAMRAGVLQDAIGDASTRVRVLASDTKNLDATMQGIQGAAGAFSVVQGAAAAFGSENEDLVKTLAKVQGSMALVNGLQQVAAVLNKDSAFSIIFLSKAKAALSTVIGTTTGALKLFRIALISTGIGAIIVGIGLLIANFDKVGEKILQAYHWFKNLGKGVKIAISIMLPMIGVINGIMWALEKLGIIDDENTKKAKENAEQRIKSMEKEVLMLGRVKSAVQARYDAEIAFARAAGESTEKLERKKELDFIKRSQRELQILKDLNKAKGGLTQEEADLYQNLTNEILKAQDRLKIMDIKKNKDIEDRMAKAAEKQLEMNKKAADKARAQAEQLEQLRLGLIADAQEREIAIVNHKYEKLIADAVGNAALISALEETQGNNIQAIKDKYLEQERQRQEKHNADIIALQRQQDEALITLIQDGAERKEAEIALAFERRIEKLQELGLLTEEVEAQLILEQEGALMELRDELAKGELDAEKARQMALLAQEKAYLDARVAMAQDTLSALSSLISISNLSSEEQAAFQQQLAIFEIAISTAASLANTIQGATAAATATGPLAPFTLAGYIATGVATVLGAFAQANQLVNRPVPKFATGVEWLNGAGTATSDSIPAYLSKGERVVPTHLNERYWDEYTAMHNGWYDKLVATKYIEPAITSLLSGTGVSSSSWRGDNIVGAISGSTKTGKKQHKQLLTAIKSNHKKSLRKW
jgi:hypothetical protein